MNALDGLKVLDLTRLGPGPFCAMMLADYGADVLRIEEPGPPTGRRQKQAGGQNTQWGIDEYPHTSAYFPLHRGKRSIGLNLKSQAGRDVFLRLARAADVVVEEFRPGVAERLGIDFSALRQINPRIIYCAITGFGQTGPNRRRAGHDINYLAASGLLSMLGPSEGPPTIPHNLVADFAGGGMYGATGILLALAARERTGEGQLVDVSMTDAVIHLQSCMLAGFLRNGSTPPNGRGIFQGDAPFYTMYRTKDDCWLSVGAVEPWFFATLCRLIGREELTPMQFDREKWSYLRSELTTIFAQRDTNAWMELFGEQDVCVMPVRDYGQVAKEPALADRGVFADVPNESGEPVRQVAPIIKLSDTPGEARHTAPARGSHTDAVLNDLGFTDEQIAAMRTEGEVG